MIGIDTNVLLRLFQLDDDPDQSARAQRAIREHGHVFVNDVVLAEFVAVSKRVFKLSRVEIHHRLEAILEAPEFEVANTDTVARAVERYGAESFDFADLLIGETNLDHGCDATLSFDKGANKSALFRPVP